MSREKFTAARFGLLLPVLVAAVSWGTAAQAAQEGSEARVIVGFKAGAAAAAGARAAIAAAGGRVVHELGEVGAVAIAVPNAALAGLARNPQVEYVEADVERRKLALTSPSAPPYQPGQLEPYGIRMVQADRLPDTYAANRKLCIVDSGYQTTHEDLAGNTADGVNLAHSGKWYTDEDSHGTHVGGTISAVDNAGVGVVGVMPNKRISLFIAKVFDASGSARSSTINRGALDCMRAGAHVVSMSLGGPDATRTDERVFNKLAQSGILSIAAAGNDGDTSVSYPAGYPSVMSVAAVDENKNWATFSQYNASVAISGPGVDVLSTVPMGTGRVATLTVGATGYAVNAMEGTPVGAVTAPLASFGLGDTIDASVTGKVCLIQRGSISFAAKVLNCQNSGGVGAVIYNNVAGALSNGTLGTTVTTIPSAGASDTDGAAMLGQLGQAAALSLTASNYASFSGTSMATPHVSAVAALVWSYFPNCSAAQIRSTLTKSALDLGDPGRDDKTGAGLVQAKAAYDRIAALGCAN